ncbi:MAG: hypothetical protein JNL74_05365, partial [Fibrobacteres bacterium]|nr:hypothetical protein [Fibrobacterota bacterium]
LELIRNRLRLTMSDGRTECSWSSDSNIILQAGNYHATVIVDGGPSIIMFVINGLLSDGGEERQFGFGRFNPNLMDINGSKQLKFLTGLSGKVELNNFRLFDSALKVNEVVNMHELGLGGK